MHGHIWILEKYYCMNQSNYFSSRIFMSLLFFEMKVTKMWQNMEILSKLDVHTMKYRESLKWIMGEMNTSDV